MNKYIYTYIYICIYFPESLFICVLVLNLVCMYVHIHTYIWIKWNLALSPHFVRRTRYSVLMIFRVFCPLLRVTYKLPRATLLFWPLIPIFSTFAWVLDWAVSCFTCQAWRKIFTETRFSLWEIPLRSWSLLESGPGNCSLSSYCFWNAKICVLLPVLRIVLSLILPILAQIISSRSRSRFHL